MIRVPEPTVHLKSPYTRAMWRWDVSSTLRQLDKAVRRSISRRWGDAMKPHPFLGGPLLAKFKAIQVSIDARDRAWLAGDCTVIAERAPKTGPISCAGCGKQLGATPLFMSPAGASWCGNCPRWWFV